jgi:glyoxylase-like metal-dependent hydrolase (beta-lactamase superfamily II)
MDFCQGITLQHLPGHTDGLIGMQINMPVTGTFFFVSDHCHVMENVSCLASAGQVNLSLISK